jgi:hypothetical protein
MGNIGSHVNITSERHGHQAKNEAPANMHLFSGSPSRADQRAGQPACNTSSIPRCREGGLPSGIPDAGRPSMPTRIVARFSFRVVTILELECVGLRCGVFGNDSARVQRVWIEAVVAQRCGDCFLR